MHIRCFLFCLLFMGLALSAQTFKIDALRSDSLTIDAGRKHGVTAGLEAFVVIHEEIGGSWHTLRMAKLRVSGVQESSSTARILDVSDGFVLQPGMEVQFTVKLVPQQAEKPPAAPPEAAPVSKPVPVVRVFGLAEGLFTGYLQLVDSHSLDLNTASMGVLSGTVTMVIEIDERGRGVISQYDDGNLLDQPQDARGLIRKQLANWINRIRFTPPRGKDGQAVRLEGWRVAFKLARFGQKLIIKRQ